jgi:dCTP deaminase
LEASTKGDELMSIVPDWRIKKLCEEGMITPYVEDQVKNHYLFVNEKGSRWESKLEHPGSIFPGQTERKVVSYGISSYGYDIRVGNKFKIFTNLDTTVIDPKNFEEKAFRDYEAEDYCIIPPNSFALAATVERFKIPRNILVIGIGKSTYARCGIILNVTPFEPEWEGHATLEISNTTPCPAKIYANEGIAQLVFFECDFGDVCATSYADKKGKYQNQSSDVTPAKV